MCSVNTIVETYYSKGSIQPEKIDSRKSAGKILHCTHTACGHAASVLSLCATQSYLFSASQGAYTCEIHVIKPGVHDVDYFSIRLSLNKCL